MGDLVLRNDLFGGVVCDKRSYMEIDVKKKGGSYRLRNGRFASKGDAIKDEYGYRLAWLEYERKKYMKMYLIMAENWRKSEKELRDLKVRVQKLAKTCQI